MRLDPAHTFKTLVMGPSNRRAVSLLRRAIGRATVRPNPVLIRGATGLGKTHLLDAAAADASQKAPGRNVWRFRGEEFKNGHISAAREGWAKETWFLIERGMGAALIVDDLEDVLDSRPSFDALGGMIYQYVASGRPVLLATGLTPRAKQVESSLRRFPFFATTTLRSPSRSQQLTAIRRSLGARVPKSTLADAVRGAATIPLARAALANELLRAKLHG